ncbi:MAG TPA: response regulator transcription factor [Solirubrobacterales bacterium]|nr:response regulator transcription factor [Solirubrobacterales bacterium]
MRVILGEDEPLMREGVAALLTAGGFEVVGQSGDGEDLLRKARAHRPDVAITDIRMPPTQTDEGLRAALEIRAELPAVGVLVLSQHVVRGHAAELLADERGGVGYLLKQRVADRRSFWDDVTRVGSGGTVIDPEVVAALLDRSDSPVPPGLTPRQREVLALMAEGRSNAAIAARLVISEKAVVRHVSQIYDRLGLRPSPDDHRRVLAVGRFLTAS